MTASARGARRLLVLAHRCRVAATFAPFETQSSTVLSPSPLAPPVTAITAPSSFMTSHCCAWNLEALRSGEWKRSLGLASTAIGDPSKPLRPTLLQNCLRDLQGRANKCMYHRFCKGKGHTNCKESAALRAVDSGWFRLIHRGRCRLPGELTEKTVRASNRRMPCFLGAQTLVLSEAEASEDK